MPNRPRNEHELQEIRQELNDLRAEYESYRKQNISSHPWERPPNNADFSTQFHDAIADQLRRRYAILRIERRVSALEKRITELESRRRSEALNSAPR